MGGGKPAPAPQVAPASAASTAGQQLQYNLDTALGSQRASMVNQSNPWGALSYNQTGTGENGVPIYTANTTLTPEMQQIISQLQGGVTGQLAGANYGGSNFYDVVGGMTEGRTKEMLDKQVAYLNPFFTIQQKELDNQLRNQGIDPYSPAYKNAMNNLSQSQNQSVTGFLAQAQPAMWAQAKESYLAPLGIAGQLMGMNNSSPFSGALVNPPQANISPVNYTDAARLQSEGEMFNAKMQAEKNKQELAYKQAMMEGLFKVPTAILGGWAGSPAGGAMLTAGLRSIGGSAMGNQPLAG